MAASDGFYRNQKALDICFAVTSTLMLVSIVGMFIQDYYRSWKPEQRDFRPVESAINLREAFAEIPDAKKFDDARAALADAKDTREKNEGKIKELTAKLNDLAPRKAVKLQAAADAKSLVESRRSFYDIAVNNHGYKSEEAHYWKKELERLQDDYTKAQGEAEQIVAEYKTIQRERDAFEKGVTQALSKLKNLNDDLIRRVKVAEKKQWTWADSVRAWPVIDGFQSPLKIQQYTITDLRLDYNFTYVTRFDRCITCHQGIDRPAFSHAKVANVQHLGKAEDKWDGSVHAVKSVLKRARFIDEDKAVTNELRNFRKYVEDSGIRDGNMNTVNMHHDPRLNTELNRALENLRDLIYDPDNDLAAKERMLNELDAEVKLVETQELLRDLRAEFKGTPEAAQIPDPDRLKITRLDKHVLTGARVKEFSAHPRLDLFVGSNSKHPAEKFGCTACHGGQPSGTDFTYASHTPNSAPQAEKWAKEHSWESIHDWEFPMQPKRFREASCLQCHHQVTDLITSDNRNQAPTVVHGFNLIREAGCFGCHEIQGQKNGRAVGPDMRLEPIPPLDALSPAERKIAESDPDNPPGTLRKVGPSLMRLSEKIGNKEFVKRWIKSPRDFRPDTRMPHYYGLSNNDKDALAGTGQEEFPDAEIASITHFLYTESNNYLEAVRQARKASPEQAAKEAKRYQELTEILGNKLELAQKPAEERDAMKKEQAKLKTTLDLRATAAPLVVVDAKFSGDAFQGRKLFSERGCLACHQHEATTVPLKGVKPGDDKFLPTIASEAHFGPNLSQVTDKLLNAKGDNKAAAQVWLTQWLKNPSVHSPRTKMPITHLTDEEARNIAAWLLEQKATQVGEGWNDVKVKEPDRDTLKKLTKVYLDRILTSAELNSFLEEGKPIPADKELPQYERELVEHLDKAKESEKDNVFKYYLGRKAVSRLGCFGCHNVPGFESAKSIGVALNDWGKKDAHRLAFEDIKAFVRNKYHVVPTQAPAEYQYDDGKAPYEQYFADALQHETRDGYLNQKIKEPRSYDYHRERAWDDRSRMPQFKFAAVRPHKGEKSDDFKARGELEEAKARESVMTFVLGLIAEPIPHKFLNNPGPDRLAEVKGKQVLDRYNCGGCHQIRPGFFDVKISDDGLKQLEVWHKLSLRSQGLKGDYNFLNHTAWNGPLAQGAAGKMPERLQVQGTRPQTRKLAAGFSDQDKRKKVDVIQLTLTTDLRWMGPDDKGKLQPKSIRAGDTIGLLARDVVFPPVADLASQEDFARWEKSQDLSSGTFADLLTKYLVDFTPPKEDERVDDSRARASVPPILMREGERVQPDWLNTWLRDPTRVREITVLRMPKFNMSPEDAKAIVAYFAGVDRIQNPGIGLTDPYAEVPQRAKFTDPYWQQKNSEYLRLLRKTPDPDNVKRTLYERRQEELKPLWESMEKDLKAEIAATKDPAAKKELEAKLARAKSGSLQKDWEENQVYFSDSFRMAGKICTQCHSMGGVKLDPKQVQGPSLDLANQRLRPDWAKRWISHPQRFLTYGSSMPVNFPSDDATKWNQYFAGEPLDRITAVRDLLMIYPRVDQLPINRYWLQFEAEAAKKAGDKK